MSKEYQIGAYYFPNFHVDPRNEIVHGPGWTEWELVKRGEPRFPGHQQPKVPLWGYEDESDPKVFAKKIDAAADHGLTHFIFDWYWYEGGFLNGCLDRGYMNADNNSRLKFALMWANHGWGNNHPFKPGHEIPLLYPGEVSEETFDGMTDHIIENYFKHPSYWTIDGCPYFSIYLMSSLIDSFGDLEGTARKLKDFRAKTKAAGFPDLHLNMILFYDVFLPGEKEVCDPNILVEALGIDSVTSYVWLSTQSVPPTFPHISYDWMIEDAEKYWRSIKESSRVPYYPNVTAGWDNTARLCQSDKYTKELYPFPVTEGNNPESFARALERVKAFLDEQPECPGIFNINAWNEWTEGSYLEPDMLNKMGYLEAIKRVFRP